MCLRRNACVFIFKLVLFTSFCNAMSNQLFPVVIIGAGVSGIAAATKLLENGVENIIILEAENKLGGRILSVKFGETFVDLGAEFCHGTRGNLVYELVNDYNLLRNPSKSFDFLYSDGSYIQPEIAADLNNLLEELSDFDVNENDKLKSFGYILRKHYNRTVIEKYRNDQIKTQVCSEALDRLENFVCDFEGCASWDDIPYFNNYDEADGDPNINWNGHGFKTIIDILTKAYPNPDDKLPIENKILFNKTVTKVILNRNSSDVIIECSDGSKYRTEQLIFTPSIGVLKKQHKQIFEPGLSEEKKQALDSLGYGNVMKVVLYFSEKWWSDEDMRTAFIWNENDKAMVLEEFPYGPTKNNRSWLADLYCLLSPGGNQNVLVAWYTGELIPEIEILPQDIIENGTMYVIKKFFGSKYEVGNPDKMIHTTWHSNPNFRGCYSYETIKSRQLNFNPLEVLAKPILSDSGKEVILFAGEATSPHHYSTVHGAIETGHREANRVLQYQKK